MEIKEPIRRSPDLALMHLIQLTQFILNSTEKEDNRRHPISRE